MNLVNLGLEVRDSECEMNSGCGRFSTAGSEDGGGHMARNAGHP